jgi:hypothetical protein
MSQRQILLTFVVLAIARVGCASDLSADQSAAVRDAEAQGRALYAAAANADPAAGGNDELVRQARARINDFCDFKYRAVVAGTADNPLVYFLGQPAAAGDLVLGRHYKVLGEAVTPSTRSCFTLPAAPNAVAPYVTHVLSDTPTEFHVYLSLAQNKPIFVGTRLGVWGVEQGKIRLVKRQQDKPVSLGSSAERDKMAATIAPLVSQAKASYPQARSRFLAGLSPGETFFVVTRVPGNDGKWEQAFVRVRSISAGRITGILASDMQTVRTYKSGDPYEFAESDLVDWVIVRPDGSEEGNVVGKFIDAYKP